METTLWKPVYENQHALGNHALGNHAMELMTENLHRKKKHPLLIASQSIHCLTKASAFVPQCKTDGVTYMKPSDGNHIIETMP